MNHRFEWWNIFVVNQLFLPYRCARFSSPLFATSLTDNRTNSIQCLSKSTPQYGCGVLDLACDFFQCICRCCRHRSMLFLCKTKAEKCQPCDVHNKCSTRYVSFIRTATIITYQNNGVSQPVVPYGAPGVASNNIYSTPGSVGGNMYTTSNYSPMASPYAAPSSNNIYSTPYAPTQQFNSQYASPPAYNSSAFTNQDTSYVDQRSSVGLKI